MTRPHFQPGTPGRVRAVVIHATAGRGPSDLEWLRRGGAEQRPVSVHYYISKAGRIVQLLPDDTIAWHAGRSRWTVDGREVENLNRVSVGIELENLNTGRDPYPEAQYASAVALTRALVQRHRVPRSQLVRHLDIAPGRKTDPAGFAWQRFVADVFASGAALEQPGQDRLRQLMLDLAYRAAGAALPAGWPLLEAARAQGLGMPVAAVTPGPPGPTPAAAQDDRDRAVRLRGQPPLLVEVYARDLLYAPVGSPADLAPPPAAARRLAHEPPGPLRDALLELMFRVADPVNGFRPAWPFHRYYLEHAAELGTPLAPTHRITIASGKHYSCKHFAFDSLCAPLGNGRRIYRLSALGQQPSDLPADVATTLRRALLDDLYRSRTGLRYDPAALLSRYASSRGLGAPLAPPERVTVEAATYLLMAFAGDVLACRLPTRSWPLEQPLPASLPIVSLVGAQVGAPTLGGVGEAGATSRLLGPPSAQPVLLNLVQGAVDPARSDAQTPERIHIVPTSGPAARDLRPEEGARWHYYIDTAGALYRLCDEGRRLEAEGEGALNAVIVAVEGDPGHAGNAQRRALSWLVRTLASHLQIPPERISAGQQRRS